MEPLVTDASLVDRLRHHQTGAKGVQNTLGTVRRRCQAVDPIINAFVSEPNRWERLTRQADALVARLATTTPKPPLYGIPIGVKDIIHVDGLVTRAGSTLPPEALTGEQASIIDRCLDAGGLVLGKTVTAEFAYFEPGPTRNPHALMHTPGGSSSGSAAAVAAGLCPLALGTQTIGSISRPAAFCGVVGVKPSYGRLPMDGVIPAAPSVDHLGYFTQDAHSAITAGQVLYPDWQGRSAAELSTIGVVDGPYLEQADDTAQEHFMQHVEALRSADYEIQRLSVFETIEEINRTHRRLVAGEMALTHSEWYATYRDRYSPQTVDLIEDGQQLSIGTVMDARASRRALRRRLEMLFEEYGLDIIVSPGAPGPAPRGLSSTGDPVMNLPWTHAGVPTVTIPGSRTDEGLPMGLQCAAPFGDDESLLAWTRTIERVLQ